MASNISVSTSLKNYVGGTGSYADALGGGFIYVYTGTVPADADADTTGATLLCQLGTFGSGSDAADADVPDAGLDFGTAGSGAIAKDTDVWTGQIQAGSAAAATFFRWVDSASDPDAADNSTDTYRIQGTVGAQGCDMNINPNTWTTGNTKTIGSAEIRL